MFATRKINTSTSTNININISIDIDIDIGIGIDIDIGIDVQRPRGVVTKERDTRVPEIGLFIEGGKRRKSTYTRLCQS